MHSRQGGGIHDLNPQPALLPSMPAEKGRRQQQKQKNRSTTYVIRTRAMHREAGSAHVSCRSSTHRSLQAGVNVGQAAARMLKDMAVVSHIQIG